MLRDLDQIRKLEKIIHQRLICKDIKDIINSFHGDEIAFSKNTTGNITGLLLHDIKIASVPEEVFYFKHLQVLDLSYNMIYEIPEELFYLYNLQILALRTNKISIIPYQISNLKKLQVVDLFNNNISYVQKKICESTHIEIKSTSPFYSLYADIEGINLFNNPILSPPLEVIVKGRDAIIQYFSSIA